MSLDLVMLDIIRQAAERLGGVPRLAAQLGVTRQAIYQWKEIPAERVRDIAAATGVPREALRPDLYAGGQAENGAAVDPSAGTESPDFSDLRLDLLCWTVAQSQALRAGDDSGLDRQRLAELLEALAEEARDDIGRRLQVIIVRLLKWQFRPDRRSLSSVGVINAERARIFARFANAASLYRDAQTALPQIYARALVQACAESGFAVEQLPADCPYTLADVLDPGFAPALSNADRRARSVEAA